MHLAHRVSVGLIVRLAAFRVAAITLFKGRYERALDEWPIVTNAGELRRVDRVVELANEVWVLDYKTGSRAAVAGTALEADYQAQVQSYCAVLRSVFPAKPVFGLVLFADGSRIRVDGSDGIQGP